MAEKLICVNAFEYNDLPKTYDNFFPIWALHNSHIGSWICGKQQKNPINMFTGYVAVHAWFRDRRDYVGNVYNSQSALVGRDFCHKTYAAVNAFCGYCYITIVATYTHRDFSRSTRVTHFCRNRVYRAHVRAPTLAQKIYVGLQSDMRPLNAMLNMKTYIPWVETWFRLPMHNSLCARRHETRLGFYGDCLSRLWFSAAILSSSLPLSFFSHPSP